MPQQPLVSVIIPTYNRSAWLKECLDVLGRQTISRSRYEIIVVDDGSIDGTHEVARLIKGVVYLHQQNQGQAAARNLGLSVARGSIVAFTDDDCIPAKDWIEQGVRALLHGVRNSRTLDGVEGITTTDKATTSPLSVITYTYHGGGFMTCNCFYKKHVLDTVGGFAASRHMRFREDTDLAWRIMDRGFTLGFDEHPRVFHRVVKLSAWQYVKKHIRIREPYWNCYLARHHPRRYRQSSEMIAGIVSTQTMYHYLFFATLALVLYAWTSLPRSSLILSIILFIEHYLLVVFLHTRMRSGIDIGHVFRRPGEFLRLAGVWWIAIISDTFWKIAGMIRFGVILL